MRRRNHGERKGGQRATLEDRRATSVRRGELRDLYHIIRPTVARAQANFTTDGSRLTPLGRCGDYLIQRTATSNKDEGNWLQWMGYHRGSICCISPFFIE